MNTYISTEYPADAALFDNVLSHTSLLPAVFVPGEGGRLEHAQSLLRSLALIEDYSLEDSQNECDKNPTFGQRLEAKLDLSILLLGRLLEQVIPPLPMRAIRWSIRGVRLKQPSVTPLACDTDGALQIQPCEWLPESLELPASVMADSGQWVWLSFPAFSPSLNDALERHLFREHRRQIARSKIAAVGGK